MTRASDSVKVGAQSAGVAGCVNLNGRFVAPGEARVSAFDRGFLYGDGAFESLRTYGGVPFRLERHLARLRSSLLEVSILDVPGGNELTQLVLTTIRRAQLDEAYVRITVTRGLDMGGPLPAPGLTSTVVIAALPLRPYPASAYEQGIAAITLWPRADGDQPPPAVKSGSLQRGVLGRMRADRRGAREGLYLDSRGHVTEGTMSNLFIVRDGVLVTPPSRDCLPGITRREVLEIARALGWETREADVTVPALASADEAFLTSSLAEIVPLVRIDDHSIGRGTPGSYALELLGVYRERARSNADGLGS